MRPLLRTSGASSPDRRDRFPSSLLHPCARLSMSRRGLAAPWLPSDHGASFIRFCRLGGGVTPPRQRVCKQSGGEKMP